MTIATETASTTRQLVWHRACRLDDIPAWCGAAALFGSRQVALLRWGATAEIAALGNLDPFSHAMVISRGIIGDLAGQRVVASPVYKQHFRLVDGVCLEDPSIRLPVYPVRLAGDEVEVGLES